MKKVIVTGASGLIGKESIQPLQRSGFEVVELKSSECNLFDFDKVADFIKFHQPDYLLHFAWITGGDYLSNPINSNYVEASYNLLKHFYDCGGGRAVFAGTCFEYDFKSTLLSEKSDLNPITLYAKNKVRLYNLCSEFSVKYNLSFSWGRIFYVYGHGEKPGRLTSSIVSSLLKNEIVTVKYGQLLRDYMYSKDIASAFVKLLESDVQDAVNICTGKGVRLSVFASKIAEKLNKTSLLKIHQDETEQPLKIIGANSRLKEEVGYNSFTDIDKAIDLILSDYMEA